jgi:hypothetical protein
MFLLLKDYIPPGELLFRASSALTARRQIEFHQDLLLRLSTAPCPQVILPWRTHPAALPIQPLRERKIIVLCGSLNILHGNIGWPTISPRKWPK